MKLCPFCGAPIPENSRFCPSCGASVAQMTSPAAPEPPAFGVRENGGPVPGAPLPVETAPIPAPAAPEPLDPIAPEDSSAYKELRMHLHQESKAWRFGAIGVLVLMMGFVGLFLSFGGFASLFFSDAGTREVVDGLFVTSILVTYAVFLTLLLLPVVIMGFVMGSKVHRYWEEAASDCGNALKHASSVGVIVLAGFFSTPALIFIIINFVKTKRNRAELDAVLAHQKAAGTVRPHG